jgi:hypothetical protein
MQREMSKSPAEPHWRKHAADSIYGSYLGRVGLLDPSTEAWKKFRYRIRNRGVSLLNRLDAFSDPILVAGCQRSGTTMLSRVIANSDGIRQFRFGIDDELDAALVLSGTIQHFPKGRYCFQTTYLNEAYQEYLAHVGGFKLLWVVRNPVSVAYSLAYNWRRFPLNELFQYCGVRSMGRKDRRRYERFGAWGVSRLRKACYSYNAKNAQLFELHRNLSSDQLLVVNYDDLVVQKRVLLSRIYEFLGIPFREEYTASIHSNSVKKADGLSKGKRETINEICSYSYDVAKGLC